MDPLTPPPILIISLSLSTSSFSLSLECICILSVCPAILCVHRQITNPLPIASQAFRRSMIAVIGQISPTVTGFKLPTVQFLPSVCTVDQSVCKFIFNEKFAKHYTNLEFFLWMWICNRLQSLLNTMIWLFFEENTKKLRLGFYWID